MIEANRSADPIRLSRGSATVGQLAGPAGMSLTGLKKHVRVLEEYRRGWEQRFDRMEESVERKKGTLR
jgi:hypothetical protein